MRGLVREAVAEAIRTFFPVLVGTGTFQVAAKGPGAARPAAADADAAGPARAWSVHDGMAVPLHGWRSGHTEGREGGDA